ncbi:hypothetical protein BGZ63DRAFT_375896 [Mariannaea sp. PMI_226]|nr:hypothetical protein BGZ63DRAFT_375896 [Mariannaea sp. PMI_226]
MDVFYVHRMCIFIYLIYQYSCWMPLCQPIFCQFGLRLRPVFHPAPLFGAFQPESVDLESGLLAFILPFLYFSFSFIIIRSSLVYFRSSSSLLLSLPFFYFTPPNTIPLPFILSIRFIHSFIEPFHLFPSILSFIEPSIPRQLLFCLFFFFPSFYRLIRLVLSPPHTHTLPLTGSRAGINPTRNKIPKHLSFTSISIGSTLPPSFILFMFKLFVHVNESGCYSSQSSPSSPSTFRSRAFPASTDAVPSSPSLSVSFSPFSSPSYSQTPSQSTTRMAKGRRPPPLNLSIVSRPRSLPRISRTPILICKESTPLLTPLPEDEYEDPPEPIVRVMRIAVDFMHLVVCMMLVVVMVIFLATYTKPMSWSYGPKAILLLLALALDIATDVRSIHLNDRSWSEWTLLARTLAAAGYLGVLIAMLVTERVFPADYTFWKMSSTQAGGPVLGLLCVILGWDIVHLILSQNRIGWWWTWLRGQYQGRSSRINSRRTQCMRGGRPPLRTMRGWSCAS